MRFVVIGAGAIGGVIGGRLQQHGVEVTLVARGAHLAAIQRSGLTIRDPFETSSIAIDAVASPAEVDWQGDEVVLLAVKSHQTADALSQLAAVAPAGISVVCVQNGINNEREALRRFENVYGCMVGLPAAHMVPGVVEAYSAPVTGILDLGRYPSGTDETALRIVEALNGATFSSRVLDDAMHWKRRKLISNLANAVEAICGPGADLADVIAAAGAEGEECFQAAGLSAATEQDDKERRADLVGHKPIDGKMRDGNSSWQSLARGTGEVETDYLNGEIALLGRQLGIATPVNVLLQRLSRSLAASGAEPGSVSADSLRAALATA